jgi:hypothetical protein
MAKWKYVAFFADGEKLSEEFEADDKAEALLKLKLVRSVSELVREDGDVTTFWQTSQVVRWWIGPAVVPHFPVTAAGIHAAKAPALPVLGGRKPTR